MRIIETKYNGYKFRSRLEARWAVFFDNIGLPFEYEPEGYDLDGTAYLPDFYIPAWDAFVEIKPKKPSKEEEEKCKMLHTHSKKIVLLIYGEPYPSKYTIITYHSDPDMDWFIGKGEFTQCRRCPNVLVSAKFKVGAEDPEWSFNLGHPLTDPDCKGCSDRYPHLSGELVDAFTAARQARFE